jgi:ATP-dependent Clp protease, protease subunit
LNQSQEQIGVEDCASWDNTMCPHKSLIARLPGMELLTDHRIVLLQGPITDDAANLAVASLLFLNFDDANKPIHLYIDSDGGSVTAALAVYDTMDYLSNPVHTHCINQAHGMAGLLFVHGTKGCRRVCRDATVCLGQLTRSSPITPSSLPKVLRAEQMLVDKLVKDTGWNREALLDELRMTTILPAEEALACGLLDQLVE